MEQLRAADLLAVSGRAVAIVVEPPDNQRSVSKQQDTG